MVLSSRQLPIEKRGAEILTKVPPMAAEKYQCAPMVEVVNHLRRLGKDKSLAVLREYLARDHEHDKVLVVCRLLFVNPKGWDAPIIGVPVPHIDDASAKRFPLFPIAVSEGVPFFLVKGYWVEGRGESAAACLKLCQEFSVVKEDYRLAGRANAARTLAQTESFRRLYGGDKEASRMSEIILRQAERE
jgi:hypothetical protein